MTSIWNKYNSVICIQFVEDVKNIESVLESLNAEIGIDKQSSFIFFTEMKRPKEGFGLYNDCTVISKSDLNYNGKLKNKQIFPTIDKFPGLAILLGDIPKRFFKLFKNKELEVIVTINSKSDFAKINFQSSSVKPNEMLNFAKNTLLKISD